MKEDEIPKGTAGIYQKWLASGKTKFTPTDEDIWCELQLQCVGDWEPLRKVKPIDLNQIEKELKPYKDKWQDYLPVEGRSNAREGLNLIGLPGDLPWDTISMPETAIRMGKKLHEIDFDEPTQLYYDLKSLHPLLDPLLPLGRSALVKLNEGGWFTPHRDKPQISRETFRIIIFLSKQCASDSFRFELGGIHRPIVPGTAYLIATQQMHQTHAYKNNSIHLVINIPKTWANVLKVMSLL
jgi:hypothetical protein